MNLKHRKVSQDLRGFFMLKDSPIPFGLLDNKFIDTLPISYKRLLADAFYRAYAYKSNKLGDSLLLFDYLNRGPNYKFLHDQDFLRKVMKTFEDIGYIRKHKKSKYFYEINFHKFVNNRDI